MDLYREYSPMESEFDAYQADWSWDSVDDDVRTLGEETTELGIAAEDTFKNAVSALYTSGFQAVTVVEAAGTEAGAHIRARIVEILRHPTLSSDQFRRIAELQSIASAFAHIGEHAREIAGHALALHGRAEAELAVFAPQIDDLLRRLVRQAYIVIRGSVVVSSSRDGGTANRVIAAAADLDRMYLDFRRAVLHAINAHTDRALLLQHILLAGAHMHEIGNQARAVCKAVRHSPPQT